VTNAEHWVEPSFDTLDAPGRLIFLTDL